MQTRMVYLDGIRRHPPTLDYAREVITWGGQIRTVPMLPARMTIIDQRTAIVASLADDSAVSAVVHSMQGTVSAPCALFERVWASAVPLAENINRDSAGLSPQQCAALEILVAGQTDQVVAKRLGGSQRTARRIAFEAMERLGALSRFQAGYKLAKTGWLEDTGA